jgi:hypothetical protein
MWVKAKADDHPQVGSGLSGKKQKKQKCVSLIHQASEV